MALFALWTLFVWGGRLRNLWLDPGGFAEASRWSLYGSLAFTVLSLVVATAWLLLRFRSTGPTAHARGPVALRGSVAALAALTIGVWLVRAVDIALGDHSVGFIVVHVALAVVSIGLAVPSVRAVLSRATMTVSEPVPGASSEPSSGAASEPGRPSVG